MPGAERSDAPVFWGFACGSSPRHPLRFRATRSSLRRTRRGPSERGGSNRVRVFKERLRLPRGSSEGRKPRRAALRFTNKRSFVRGRPTRTGSKKSIRTPTSGPRPDAPHENDPHVGGHSELATSRVRIDRALIDRLSSHEVVRRESRPRSRFVRPRAQHRRLEATLRREARCSASVLFVRRLLERSESRDFRDRPRPACHPQVTLGSDHRAAWEHLRPRWRKRASRARSSQRSSHAPRPFGRAIRSTIPKTPAQFLGETAKTARI